MENSMDDLLLFDEVIIQLIVCCFHGNSAITFFFICNDILYFNSIFMLFISISKMYYIKCNCCNAYMSCNKNGFILHSNSLENDVKAKTLRTIPGIPFLFQKSSSAITNN